MSKRTWQALAEAFAAAGRVLTVPANVKVYCALPMPRFPSFRFADCARSGLTGPRCRGGRASSRRGR